MSNRLTCQDKAEIISLIVSILQFIGKIIPQDNATVVHIFGQTPHHYVPMKSFFNQYVGSATKVQQQFWAWQHQRGAPQKDVQYYQDSAELLNWMLAASESTRFIFHGLFDRSLFPKLFLSALPKRCSWVCWGADLHQHDVANKSIKMHIMWLLHVLLARRFNKVYSLNKGDKALLQQKLHAPAVEVLPYPLIASDSQPKDKSNTNQPIKVLVGNSAAPSNLHAHALDLLKHLSSQPIEFILPLNYAGTKDYVESVIQLGDSLFSNQLTALTSMLDKNEYDCLLTDIDIVVFTHKRQQGLYVIYSALKNGQKVFVDGQSSTYHSLCEDGFTIFKSETIANLDFDEFVRFDAESQQKNRELMLNTFSQNVLKTKWACAIDRLCS